MTRYAAFLRAINVGGRFVKMDALRSMLADVKELEGVETYPALFKELARRGWSDQDLAKLSGGNVLRAMERAEQVAAAMRAEPAMDATIEQLDAKK